MPQDFITAGTHAGHWLPGETRSPDGRGKPRSFLVHVDVEIDRLLQSGLAGQAEIAGELVGELQRPRPR